MPVYMCVHPELNQYIRDVLLGIRSPLAQGLVEKLVVVIKNKVSSQRFVKQLVSGHQTK